MGEGQLRKIILDGISPICQNLSVIEMSSDSFSDTFILRFSNLICFTQVQWEIAYQSAEGVEGIE